jgi:hypothetical protein
MPDRRHSALLFRFSMSAIPRTIGDENIFSVQRL